MVKEAHSMHTCPPTSFVNGQLCENRGSSKNWNFCNILMNYQKPREAFRAPVLLFKRGKKPRFNETVMSRYEFCH